MPKPVSCFLQNLPTSIAFSELVSKPNHTKLCPNCRELNEESKSSTIPLITATQQKISRKNHKQSIRISAHISQDSSIIKTITTTAA